MINLLFILIAFLIYGLWFKSYTYKNKNVFFFIFLLLTIFHDFIFIHLEYVTSKSIAYIIKSWQEYLLLFLIGILFLRKKITASRTIFVVLISILLLSLDGLIVGLLHRNLLFEISLGWRSYFLPLAVCFMVYWTKGFEGLSVAFFYRMIIIVSLMTVVGSIYQIALFSQYDLNDIHPNNSDDFIIEGTKILKNFWFYDKFGALHMLQSWPNYIRNGSVRTTSFFVSPIAFAEFLTIPIVILIAKWRHGSRATKIKYLSAILFLLLGSYLSNARIGLLLVALSVIIIQFLSSGRFKSNILWSLLASIIILTFIALYFFRIGDDSAQGRLIQYAQMIQNFKIGGYGFGSAFSQTYFDSLYISVIMLLGVLSPLYFFLHFYLLEKVYNIHLAAKANSFNTILSTVSLTVALDFTFAFAFQYSIGSNTILLIYFLFFFALSDPESSDNTIPKQLI